MLRGRELLQISTTLSIIPFYLMSMTVSDFRPVQLRLLRPRRFSWLLRFLKDRRSQLLLLLCMVLATEEVAKDLCC